MTQFIKQNWLAFLLAFVLPIAIIFWWWGGFNRATISEIETQPTYYAYTEYYGSYGNLGDAQQKVYTALTAQKITPGKFITILYADPRTTSKHDQHARVGYLLPANTVVKPPILTDTLPARRVLRATAQGSLMLAPSIAYQGLHDYLKPQSKDITMPSVEIYTAGTSINEMGTLTIDIAN
jgi:effector-binding domain-containing protein